MKILRQNHRSSIDRTCKGAATSLVTSRLNQILIQEFLQFTAHNGAKLLIIAVVSKFFLEHRNHFILREEGIFQCGDI